VLYRLLRTVNANYALTVFWFYVCAFGLAMLLIFVFPPLPLFLLFLGVAGLGLLIVLAKCLTAFEHVLARHFLRQGTCPMCQQPGPAPARVGDHWQCVHCGAAYLESGAIVLKA
jgi:hypothetical protein